MSAIESMNGQHDGQPTESNANVPVDRSAIMPRRRSTATISRRK
jgi:hypothetical protein